MELPFRDNLWTLEPSLSLSLLCLLGSFEDVDLDFELVEVLSREDDDLDFMAEVVVVGGIFAVERVSEDVIFG